MIWCRCWRRCWCRTIRRWWPEEAAAWSWRWRQRWCPQRRPEETAALEPYAAACAWGWLAPELHVESLGDPAVYSDERGIAQAWLQASFPGDGVRVHYREPLAARRPLSQQRSQASALREHGRRGRQAAQRSNEAASVHDNAGQRRGATVAAYDL